MHILLLTKYKTRRRRKIEVQSLRKHPRQIFEYYLAAAENGVLPEEYVERLEERPNNEGSIYTGHHLVKKLRYKELWRM